MGKRWVRGALRIVVSSTLLTALLYSPLGAVAAAGFGPDAVAAATNDSANSRWLDNLYVDTLGRAADDGGLDFWLGRIAAGGAESREEVARAFVYSPEGSRIEVRRAYADLLQRLPDPGGEEYWTNYLLNHPVKELRSIILASDEFVARSGGVGPWIERLYLEVVGRPADEAGRAYWTGLEQRGEPRPNIVSAMYLSSESLGRRADAYAQEILGRRLTARERNAALSLVVTGDERALRARLLASDEAFEPFLSSVGLLTLDPTAGDRTASDPTPRDEGGGS